MPKVARELFEPHFPTTVMLREHEDMDEIHAQLRNVILDLEREFGETDRNAATNGASTTQGGFQSPADMDFLDIDSPVVDNFKRNIILPAVESYLAEVWKVNPLFTPIYLKSWANILRKGNWQGPHMHPTEFTIISAVYYVTAPELEAPAGWLEFINPHPISVTLGAQEATRQHKPVAGQLLLFPPYYMHFVHPLTTDVERVVISFDVRLPQREPRQS